MAEEESQQPAEGKDYRLVGWTDAGEHSAPLSAVDRDALELAVNSVFRLLSIEEKFDMLAENYDELEGAISTVGRRRSLFGVRPWHESIADVHLINRRLINYLSSARQYLDQTDHDLCRLYGKESVQRREYNANRSSWYDKSLEFRVFEELRNYAQHRDVPAHSLATSMEHRPDGTSVQTIHTTGILLDVRRVKEEGKFKQEVLAEIAARGEERLEIKPMLRKYMTGLYHVQMGLRASVAPTESDWREHIGSAVSCLREAAKGRELDTFSIETMDRATGAMVWVRGFSGFLDRLDRLRDKNRLIGDLTRQLRHD